MEFHGPCVMVWDVPGGPVVATPPVHMDGHSRDVAGGWGQQKTDWTRNLNTNGDRFYTLPSDRGKGRTSIIQRAKHTSEKYNLATKDNAV